MVKNLSSRVLDRPLTYTGRELRPHWGLEQTGVYGSLITAFIGPCEVPTEHLVDYEDRLERDFIRAKSMLHFIIELFGTSLEAGILYQRMLVVSTYETLLQRGIASLKRCGDDLFINEQKLSVSIATSSPVSVLIHFGINIDATGAPVAAVGLLDCELKTDTQVLSFAKEVLTHYIKEIEEIQIAQCKVRPVL